MWDHHMLTLGQFKPSANIEDPIFNVSIRREIWTVMCPLGSEWSKESQQPHKKHYCILQKNDVRVQYEVSAFVFSPH